MVVVQRGRLERAEAATVRVLAGTVPLILLLVVAVSAGPARAAAMAAVLALILALIPRQAPRAPGGVLRLGGRLVRGRVGSCVAAARSAQAVHVRLGLL